MSVAGTVVVPLDVLRKADDLIKLGMTPSATSAQSVRQGVELLLQNNLALVVDTEQGSLQNVKILPGQVCL